jgi:hypothetical protein
MKNRGNKNKIKEKNKMNIKSKIFTFSFIYYYIIFYYETKFSLNFTKILIFIEKIICVFSYMCYE